MKIPANGFTHAGKFHADDVFATALLQILRPDIKITRGFVVPDDFDGIVYDVGFGMFDHHQEPRECRPNGVPYAALGLLWRVLGPGLVGERQARLIDENFILAVPSGAEKSKAGLSAPFSDFCPLCVTDHRTGTIPDDSG